MSLSLNFVTMRDITIINFYLTLLNYWKFNIGFSSEFSYIHFHTGIFDGLGEISTNSTIVKLMSRTLSWFFCQCQVLLSYCFYVETIFWFATVFWYNILENWNEYLSMCPKVSLG